MSVKRILESLGISEGSLILDLGCGNGRISVNLAKLGFRVVGVDISPIFIEDAIEKAKLHGVEGRVVFRVVDARRVDEELGGMLFDVILIYWTTILGFYGDKSVDIDILRRARRITRDGGYLLVLNSASYDSVALRAGLVGAKASYYTDVDEELARVSVSDFDPARSVLTVTRRYYRKSEGNLLFLDEVTFKVRAYTLHELIGMAEESGWQYVKAYKDVNTLEPYTPIELKQTTYQKRRHLDNKYTKGSLKPHVNRGLYTLPSDTLPINTCANSIQWKLPSTTWEI